MDRTQKKGCQADEFGNDDDFDIWAPEKYHEAKMEDKWVER